MYVLRSFKPTITRADNGCRCGMALRLAMDVGAHKKKAYQSNNPNSEEEQWKRAFWYVFFAKIKGLAHISCVQDSGRHGQMAERSIGAFVLNPRGRVRSAP